MESKLSYDYKTTKKRIKRRIKSVMWKGVNVLRDYPQYKKENARNPSAEYPRIVVVGRNYCSNLDMARALGKAGYEIEVLRIFQFRPRLFTLAKIVRSDAYSKYIKAYHVCVARGKTKRIVDKLKKIADLDRKMLLIPVDDLVADVIDRYMEELSPYYIMSNVNNTPGELSRLMSKRVQKEMAQKFGLPMVKCNVISTEKGEFEIPSAITYPCFVKPNISKNAFKTSMKKCDSKEELRQWIEKLAVKHDVEMLVEDYVEIDKEYALLGLSTKQGTIAPGYLVVDEGGHDARRGVAMTGRTVSCFEAQPLINNIIEFVKTLNFEGLFDVDLIKTKDGKLLFSELNLRFGGSGYAITQSGINLPGMYADYKLKGKDIDCDCAMKELGKTFINEKVMIDEYIHGYLSKNEVVKRMKSVDIHFIMDKDDPMAYKHFKKILYLVDYLKWLIRLKIKWANKRRQ